MKAAIKRAQRHACIDTAEREQARQSHVWQHIIELTGVRNSSDFQKLDRDKQRESLRRLGAASAEPCLHGLCRVATSLDRVNA